ncbi:MAG TPA: hypothetical protein VH088_03165 [Terriglobales bacterium]|jgi:hypothetical protein|nr:hypothetical protein [Terriglobales bacterium]
MLRTSLLVVVFTFGMLACSKEKVSKPLAKAPAKEVSNAREKAPKPSPYIYKAPRQVSAVNRDAVAPRRNRPQPE